MAGREYFKRQAAILFKYAKAIADPEVAAGLVEKAADLKEQGEQPHTMPVTRRPTPPAGSPFRVGVGN